MQHEDFTIALHEAGHGIVAAALGRNVDRSTISITGGLTYVDVSWQDRGQADDVGAILLAGQVAEALFAGALRSGGSDEDNERLANVAALSRQTDFTNFCWRCSTRAAVVLRTYQPQVHRVAADLLATGRVDASHASLAAIARAFEISHSRGPLNCRRIAPPAIPRHGRRVACVCNVALNGEPLR